MKRYVVDKGTKKAAFSMKFVKEKATFFTFKRLSFRFSSVSFIVIHVIIAYDMIYFFSKTVFWMIKLTIDMMKARINASPNPDILKESPIMADVIMSVKALMTNKNKPNVRIVAGNVKIIKMGLTSILRIERTKLATIAATTPDTSIPEK